MEIKNSTFLITGGASGLGAATARGIAAAGGNVVIADLNTDAGNALAKELGRARCIKTDVTSEADGKAAVALALKEFGGLQGLINSAGIYLAERTLGKDGPHALASFSRVVTINLIGSFNMIRLAADTMSRGQPNAGGERGVIINTASVAAFDGPIGVAAYSASKAAVVGMTLPIARDLARYGIRVMTIAPGVFATPMGLGMPKATNEVLATMVPFPPRFGRPPEYAALALHIIENEMLNGEASRIDGAIRISRK